MKRLWFGCVLVAGAFATASIWPLPPIAVGQDDRPQQPEVSTPAAGLIEARSGRDVAGSGDLIGFSHVNDSGTQVITIVHTRKLSIVVYHVGPGGEIRLVSSRPIDADFSLEFNATEPLPEDIRRLRGSAGAPRP